MLGKLIHRPVAVTMTLIIVIILGVVSIRMLPVSLIPQVNIPFITVQVVDHSKSARELHEVVVNPLRLQLSQMAGLKDIRTETKDGSGTITLTFDHGANTDYLFIETNEKIDRAMSSLPKELQRPNVLKANATDIPAFYINMTVSGHDETDTGDALYPVSGKFSQLSAFANNVIVKRIEQLSEVAMVDVSGLVKPEILIIPDHEELRRLKITPSEFEKAVNSVNINIGNLTIRDGEYQYNVNIRRSATSKEDIENVYIKVSGRILRIKDLAKVIEHPQQRTGIVSSDFKNAVTLAVIKQSDAKMSQLRSSINGLLRSFKREYPDIDFQLTRDQTELLDYSINNLVKNIILGIFFASVIIFLFMKNLRSAFIIVITIPFALILSMLLFFLLGLSINIISLSGLVLGVGMMVDNSIILIDNITFRWSSGHTLRDAVVKGTGEVFSPMLSSVLTTCAVFIPLIFISGIAGALFYDQAMAVTITLLSSLLATVTVIPVYFYLMFRKKEGVTENRLLSGFSFDKVLPYYEKSLKFFFRRRYIIYISFVVALAGIFFVYSGIRKERLPDITYLDTLVNIDWNERITVEENSRRSNDVASHIRNMAEQVTVMAGTQQFILSHTKDTGISEAVIYIKQHGKYSIAEIQDSIAGYIETHYPRALFGFETSGNIFDMVFSEKEEKLVARLRSGSGRHPDPPGLITLLAALQDATGGAVTGNMAYNEHLLYIARPEIMSLYNVTFSELEYLLKSALNQNLLFTITQGINSVPVIVGDNKSGLTEILRNVTVPKNGVDIPVDIFFRQTREMDLKTLVSGPEGNFYPVGIDVPDSEVPRIMQSVKNEVRKTQGFEVSFSGSYFSNREMVRQFVMILLVSFLLLYFILASQFESLVQPFIILSEMFLDIFITMLVLWVLGISLNIMSLIGIIVTCGIVINDSILKIDTINMLRKEGHSVVRAVMEAGQRRLKAIVMTSATTILAISPFLARGDMGSDLQYPLSVSIISGMVAGTFVSIYFIPLIYYTIYGKR